MSDIMTIEQLDETSASELTDNDLLMTSVWNGSKYISKRMNIQALKDYVMTGNQSSSSSSQYLIYDVKENETEQYVIDLTPNNEEKTFSKTVSQDCMVLINENNANYVFGNNEYGFIDNEGDDINNTQLTRVFINGVRIWTQPLGNQTVYGNGVARFYLKKNQTIKVKKPANKNPAVSIVPLRSGGEFFIDPSKTAEFKYGIFNPNGYSYTGNIYPPNELKQFVGNDIKYSNTDDTNIKRLSPGGLNYTFRYTASTLCVFSCSGGGNYSINGWELPAHTMNFGQYVILDVNDTVQVSIYGGSGGGGSLSLFSYGIYPLLMD